MKKLISPFDDDYFDSKGDPNLGEISIKPEEIYKNWKVKIMKNYDENFKHLYSHYNKAMELLKVINILQKKNKLEKVPELIKNLQNLLEGINSLESLELYSIEKYLKGLHKKFKELEEEENIIKRAVKLLDIQEYMEGIKILTNDELKL